MPAQARRLRRAGGRGRLPAARRAGRSGGARGRGGPARGRRAAPRVGAALRAGRARIGGRQYGRRPGRRRAAAAGAGPRPGDRVELPYDAEARFRSKAGASWTGYMVHLTETCDEGLPALVVHADTTPANVHEAMRTAPIQDALAAKGLAPSEHLVDAGYVSAEHLVAARERHGIDLIGPRGRTRAGRSRRRVPSASPTSWWTGSAGVRAAPRATRARAGASTGTRSAGRPYLRVGFSPADCRPCPSKSRCTRAPRPAARPAPAPGARGDRRRPGAADSRAGRRLYASAKVSRARSRRASAPSACAGRATAGWPRRACKTWPPPPPSTSTASRHGSPRRPLAPTRTSRFAALAA